jgi:hypothetical protein
MTSSFRRRGLKFLTRLKTVRKLTSRPGSLERAPSTMLRNGRLVGQLAALPIVAPMPGRGSSEFDRQRYGFRFHSLRVAVHLSGLGFAGHASQNSRLASSRPSLSI